MEVIGINKPISDTTVEQGKRGKAPSHITTVKVDAYFEQRCRLGDHVDRKQDFGHRGFRWARCWWVWVNVDVETEVSMLKQREPKLRLIPWAHIDHSLKESVSLSLIFWSLGFMCQCSFVWISAGCSWNTDPLSPPHTYKYICLCSHVYCGCLDNGLDVKRRHSKRARTHKNSISGDQG